MTMVAILENIRSMHNVGSILRTADAAGFEKVYLAGFTPAPTDELGRARVQVTKVSLGAEESVAWEKVRSVVRLIARLRRAGYAVYALEQGADSLSYDAVSGLGEKIALIVGNEVSGVEEKTLARVDGRIEIPMHGKKESLNVAVAFGIAAFALRRAAGSRGTLSSHE